MAADASNAGLTSSDAASHREQCYRSLYIATVFLTSIPVALVAPGIAPFMWLALFFDPAARFALAALGDEGDRLALAGAADGEAAVGAGGLAAVGAGQTGAARGAAREGAGALPLPAVHHLSRLGAGDGGGAQGFGVGRVGDAAPGAGPDRGRWRNARFV